MPLPITVRPPVQPRTPYAPKVPTNPNPDSCPFPFGDSKPPGNKRPNDTEDCDEICVYAKVPNYLPKRIVYTYPNELPVVIEGENYTKC
jgi:hypothetical protein